MTQTKPIVADDAPKRFQKVLRGKDVHAVETKVYPGLKSSPTFPLAYTHSGAGEGRPVLVVIPGGPGFASVVPYVSVRPQAVASGFEVVMVEHRGVGLSRRDFEGEDLPVDAMRVEHAARDILAVLDHLGVEKAWLHGTSYGGYLSQVFGAMFPERVSGMFLDCTWHRAADENETREYNRDLFLRGVRPDGFPEGLSPGTKRAAAKVREILDRNIAPEQEVLNVVPPVYEFLGPEVLDQVLSALLAGRRAEWNWFAGLVGKELDEISRCVMEAEPSVAIHYRQLQNPVPDGKPFDTALTWTERSNKYPPFEGEPFDLGRELPKFDWPVVLFSGERDTRTPPFRLRRMDELLPNSVHITFPNVGHDLLRFRTKEILAIERTVVQNDSQEAALTASGVVTQGDSHPLSLIGRVFGGYLSVREFLARRSTKRVAILSLVVGVLLKRASRK